MRHILNLFVFVFLNALLLQGCGRELSNSQLTAAEDAYKGENEPWFYLGLWQFDDPTGNVIYARITFLLDPNGQLELIRGRKKRNGEETATALNHSETLTFLSNEIQLIDDNTLYYPRMNATFTRRTPREPIPKDEFDYPSNSPVPDDVKIAIKNQIKPYTPAEAQELDSELKKWEGQLNEKQKLVLESIKLLGIAFKQSIISLSEDSTKVSERLRSIVSGATQAAKNVSTCLAKVGASGDYADWYEITTGRDYCTGETITVPGRVITAVGLIIGQGKFWRAFGDAVGVATSVGKLARSTAELNDSAKKIGLNAVQTKAYAKFYEGLKDLPINLQPKRLHAGSNDRIAVIGRSMGNPAQGKVGVRDVGRRLNEAGYSGKVDLFDGDAISQAAKDDFRIKTENYTRELSEVELKLALMYQENKNWIEKIKAQGNTIIDIGDPNNESIVSYFYEMEKKIIFGE